MALGTSRVPFKNKASNSSYPGVPFPEKISFKCDATAHPRLTSSPNIGVARQSVYIRLLAHLHALVHYCQNIDDMTLIVEGYIQFWVLQSCDKKAQMPFHRFVCSTREITAARLTRVPFSFKNQASNSTNPGVSSPEKIFFSTVTPCQLPRPNGVLTVARQSVHLYVLVRLLAHLLPFL